MGAHVRFIHRCTDRARNGIWWTTQPAHFAQALLLVLVAAIISRYGVNVPYGDEWSVLSLFEKWESRQLTFAGLFAEHNGHWILIPRLIYLGLIQLTHGNTGLFLLLRRTVRGATLKHLVLWAFMNLFLFSPIPGRSTRTADSPIGCLVLSGSRDSLAAFGVNGDGTVISSDKCRRIPGGACSSKLDWTT